MESTSKNFTYILHSGLDRARKSPNSGIVKLDRSHWGLTEWYPKGILNSAAASSKKEPKKKQRKRKSVEVQSAPKGKAETVKSVDPIPISPAKGETVNRFLKVLESGGEFTPKQVAERLGMDAKVAHMNLAKLVKKNKAEKTASGNYRLAGAIPEAKHAVV
jgi:hypothetical protein